MKYQISIALLVSAYSFFAIGGCEETSIEFRGVSSTEAIESARSIIPAGYRDNSFCASPIIRCDEGFTFDKKAEICTKGSETGVVTATLAIKSI